VAKPSVVGAALLADALAECPADWEAALRRPDGHMETIRQRRLHLGARLGELVAAGLPRHSAFSLLRMAVAGDSTYHLRVNHCPDDVSAALDTAAVAAMTQVSGLTDRGGEAVDRLFLPTKRGGFGLQSASRVATAAWYASWSEALGPVCRHLAAPDLPALRDVLPGLAIALEAAARDLRGQGAAPALLQP